MASQLTFVNKQIIMKNHAITLSITTATFYNLAVR